MTSKETESSEDHDFVDVDLHDQPPPKSIIRTANARHLGTRLRSGWLSQVTLHPHLPSSTSHLHSVDGGIQHTIASSSTPDLHAIAQGSAGSLPRNTIYQSSPMAGTSVASMTPSALPRKVEGRYRSRLENPKSARLRPLILSKEPQSSPQGVQFDAQMKPGMTMTIRDSNGELIMVRSPMPDDHEEYTERVLTPLASKLLLQSGRSKSAQCDLRRYSPDINDSPSLERSRKKQQENTKTSSSEPDDASDTDTSLTQTGQLDRLHISSRGRTSQGFDCDTTSQTTTSSPSGTTNLGLSESADGKKTNLTRMLHLPPKPPQEEAKHLADFSAMMQASQKMQKMRIQSGKAESRKRMEKEAHARQIWDQEILPCWTRAREEPKYRDLWWDGIPSALRGRIWLRACGNNLMLSHNLFGQALVPVQQALSDGKIPLEWIEEIESDISQTLPSLRLFEAGTGPLYEDLKNVTLTFAFVRADEASQREKQPYPDLTALYQKYSIYVPGTASLAALLLLNMSPAQAFLALLNLISSKPWLKAMYKLDTRRLNSDNRSSELLGYDRVFNALLAERMPDIYANLHKMNIRPLEYLHGWIQTLFVPWLEIDTVSHLWDIMYVRTHN